MNLLHLILRRLIPVLAVVLSLGSVTAHGQPSADNIAEWRKTAEQGYATAQYNLGVSYASGQGVIKNAIEAVKWYRKAADQGHVGAQYNLGNHYHKGIGVVKDDVEAVKWYLKAAEQGDVDAQFNVGNQYAKGQGVVKDAVEAYKWFSIAASSGDLSSAKNRELIAKEMAPNQIAEAQRLSREWKPKK